MQNRFRQDYNVGLNGKPFSGWTFRTEFGYNWRKNKSDQVWAVKATQNSKFGYAGQPQAYFETVEYKNWRNANTITYDNKKLFGNRDRLNVMIGQEWSSTSQNTRNSTSVSFPATFTIDEVLANTSAGTALPNGSDIEADDNMLSFFGRVNYTLMDKYLLTATVRADGSSKFGKDNKWAFFPSGAFSWKINEESFLEDAKWLDVLKIRASYGISGNQGISAYQTLSRYGQHKYFHNGAWVTAIGPGYQSGYAGQGGIYAVWSGIPNTGLKWETTSQVDVGLDFSAFGNRLNVTFDWYDKVTDDLLRERNIAPSSGYDKMWVNDGKIRNRGIELTVDGVFFRNRDWNVGGTFVFSRNRNEVLSLGNALEAGLNTDKRTGMQFEYYGNSMEQFRSYTNILAVGQPMYVFYGYQVNGMVQSLAEGLEAGLSGDDALPGEFKYMDIYNEDGMATINEDDRCIIGDPNPDWTASLALNASWKNLDLSLFFNGVFGNDVLNTKRFDQPDNSPLRWTEDNPTDKYPRLNANRQTKLSDWWIEDGSFVRLQTVTLGYTLPFRKNDTSKSVRLYVSGDNVFTFSKFGGYDPEVGILGIYYGGYPRLRKWTIGVDFTF